MGSRSTIPPISAIDQNVLKGKKPNKIVSVPLEFRRPSYSRERNLIVNDVKTSTGCDVVLHWNYQRDHDQGIIYQFDIFGTGAGLERAIRHVNQWILKAHSKSKDSAAWAKMPAFDPDKWYSEQIGEMEYQRKKGFKESPSGNQNLYKMIVRWPTELDDRDISPRDVFSNKLEALDAIRTRDEVYINLLGNKSGDWQIEIQAPEIANLEAAEEHLKNMIEKVKAEEMGLYNTVSVVLDDQEGMEVIFKRTDAWWPKTDRVVPRLLPNEMMDPPGSFRGEGLHPVQLSKIQRSFQLALEAVRHRKGAYDLAIRLGCLSLRSKQFKDADIGKKHKKEAFLRSIHGSLELGIERWLTDDASGQHMLKSLCSADKFLEPTKSSGYSGYRPDILDKTRPMFRGTWLFSDPSTSIEPPGEPIRHSGRPKISVPKHTGTLPSNMIVVQVDWTDDEEGLYEKNTPRFYRLEEGSEGSKKHMDINLLELGESRGWHLALESMIPVSSKSVSPILNRFAEQVKMRNNHDHQSTGLFAEWEKTPAVKKYLLTGRLDAIYSFGIKETSYKVELTRIWYPNQARPVWSLAIRHTEWANRLTELEHLPIGRKADWGDTITTFLPNDGQSSYTAADETGDLRIGNLDLGLDIEAPPRNGIRILMDKLLQVSVVVGSVMNNAGSIAT